MEKSATYFILDNGQVSINQSFLVPKVQNYNYDIFSGLEYNIDLTQDFGNRITYMRRNGVDIDLNQNYSIVINNYRASNTAVYPSYAGAKILQEIDRDMGEIIIDYIRSHHIITVNPISNYSISY